MIQFSYKSETVGNLLKNPVDRSIAVGKLIKKLGGKMLGFYYSYGDYDGLVLADMPDSTSGFATTMVSFAGRGTTKIKTTVLITIKEAMAAMKKASRLKLAQPKN